MSALSSPLWGREAGSLPILTARATRRGTLLPGAGTPVSGQFNEIFPGWVPPVVVVELVPCVVVVVELCPPFFGVPPEMTAAKTTPTRAPTTAQQPRAPLTLRVRRNGGPPHSRSNNLGTRWRPRPRTQPSVACSWRTFPGCWLD